MPDRVSIKIPRPLYERLQYVIADSGFSSPTDFIVYVLRDLIGSMDRNADSSSNRLSAVFRVMTFMLLRAGDEDL